MRSGFRDWLTDRRLLTCAVLVWCVLALLGLVLGPSLGHDEAAFSLAARGEAPAGEWLYRSTGTIAIARLGIALGGAPWQLRLASALLGPLAVVAVYAVGRAAFSPRTGAWAAAIVAGAHPMVLRNAELLSDLPAMAGVLGGIAVLVAELERDTGPRRRILAAAPLFAAAFYVRYGSGPVIVFAIAASNLVWWRGVARRPLPMLAMVAALAMLVVPHLWYSRAVTGRVFGILQVSAGMPRRAYVGEGLVTYLTSNPLLFYGAVVAPVMVAGLLGMVRMRRKAAWYLAVIALGQIVSLGLQSHGQPRYVFVATALLVVLGVETLAHHRLARPRAAFALVALSWLGVAIAAPIYYHHIDDARAPIVEAAQVIRAHGGDRPCIVVALIAPQLMWYSGCGVVLAPLLVEPLPADRDRYAVSFALWPIDVSAVLAAQHLQATPIATRDPRARVYRLQ
jgi:4-amino-4-deoxy-L-arabinose transferase-like glycosyltransferase